MKNKTKRLLAAMLGASMLLSCAGCTTTSVIESLENDIADLEDDIDELKEKNESLKIEIQDAEEREVEPTESEPEPDTDPGDVTDKPIAGYKVGVSMPTKDLARWKNDGEAIKLKLVAGGVEVDLQYASNDTTTQLMQVENMIKNGCRVLIIAPVDSTSFGEVLTLAAKKQVKVISYDRLISGIEDVDYLVTFDMHKTGQLQAEYIVNRLNLDKAKGPFNIEFTGGDIDDSNGKKFFEGAMKVLMPYIAEGKLNVLSDQCEYFVVATPEWSTDRAKGRAENLIREYYSDGTNIDAWLCSNDTVAAGVIAALSENYTGSWPIITGQDCDILNVKYIIAGKQSMSVFRDTRTLAMRAAEMAKQILDGEEVDINSTDEYDNGSKVVPAYLCDPVFADANNYKEILIDSGYYTEADLK